MYPRQFIHESSSLQAGRVEGIVERGLGRRAIASRRGLLEGLLELVDLGHVVLVGLARVGPVHTIKLSTLS